MPLLLLRPRGLLRRRLLSVSSALALALPLAPDSLDCSSAVSKGATTAAAPSTSGCVDCSWSVPTPTFADSEISSSSNTAAAVAAKDVEEGFSSKAEQPLLFNKLLPDSKALDTAHCDGLG